MVERAHEWAPLMLSEIALLFKGVHFDWWLAGGYALDLHVGRSWRSHDDIDIMVLRPDLPALLAHLDNWDIWFADPPGHLRPRLQGEMETHAHDIWLRRAGSSEWHLQVMVDEASAGRWQSRRNPALTRTKSELGWHHASGMPCLAPEIQLFYKAKAPRPKDESDFVEVLPHLNVTQKTWLGEAIEGTYGPTHPWLLALR